MVFFSSPGKVWLIKKLKVRNANAIERLEISKDQKQPLLGLPEDPGRDVDEAVREIKQEVEARQRKGSKIEMPRGEEMRKVIEQKTGQRIS